VRYRGGVTPWDAGGVPPALEAWLRNRSKTLRVLVPGAGTGYEVKLFAGLGHEVLAIDFSDAAIEAARRELGRLADRVRKVDFFDLPEKHFDLVYERAFLCALPRSTWARWADRLAELVRPGGELAGFFYFDDNVKGPPFGISSSELAGFLTRNFVSTDDRAIPAPESLPVFKGKERWQVWQRRL
jgi:hypothetical protein